MNAAVIRSAVDRPSQRRRPWHRRPGDRHLYHPLEWNYEKLVNAADQRSYNEVFNSFAELDPDYVERHHTTLGLGHRVWLVGPVAHARDAARTWRRGAAPKGSRPRRKGACDGSTRSRMAQVLFVF